MSRAADSFRIVLKAQKQNVPAIARLRRTLKYALRECGLDCVSVVDATAPLQGVERELAGTKDKGLGEGAPRAEAAVSRVGHRLLRAPVPRLPDERPARVRSRAE